MSEKTIRVDDTVHEQLRDRKRRTDSESFNEVLKRELGIIPSADDLDTLTAYLEAPLAEAVREMVSTVHESADVTARVEPQEHGDDYNLVFVTPESGHTVAKLVFRDQRVEYEFRTTRDEWSAGAAAAYDTKERELRLGERGTGAYSDVSLDDVCARLRRTASSAAERWNDP